MYGQQNRMLVRLPTDLMLLGRVKAISSWQSCNAERCVAPRSGCLVAGERQLCYYLLHWHSAFRGVRLPKLCNPHIRLDPADGPEWCTSVCMPAEPRSTCIHTQQGADTQWFTHAVSSTWPSLQAGSCGITPVTTPQSPVETLHGQQEVALNRTRHLEPMELALPCPSRSKGMG